MSEAERHRALLDARSGALAARGAARAHRAEHRTFLVCSAGAEHYGVPLAATAAVMPGRPCTPIPGGPAALRGIVAQAGLILSVIDLALALGLGSEAASEEAGHFLRLRDGDPPVALAVDRVLGLATIEADAIEAATPADGGLGVAAVSGYAPAGPDRNGVAVGFAILDLPSLLRPFLS